MNSMGSNEKPLYCHWDTHDHDVLFMSENELDRHLYSHFYPNSQEEQAELTTYVEPKQAQNVECHWDACHEMIDIDEIMEHFRNSHQEHSFHPHHGNCSAQEFDHADPHKPVDPTSSSSSQKVADELSKFTGHAYVRLNPDLTPAQSVSSASMTYPAASDKVLEQKPKLDTSSLPSLDTPRSIPYESHRCMWCMFDGHVCGEEFMTSSELNAHIVHCHIGRGVNSCRWTGCGRDKAPFPQRQKLVRHLQVHAKTLDHKCRVCNKPLACDAQLRAHERQHTNDRPYECPQCGKQFTTRNSLTLHIRTHTGSKPLVCNYPGCGKRFAESSNLAKHRRIHGPPQFQCMHCKRMFTRKDHLHRHMRAKHQMDKNDINEALSNKPQNNNTIVNTAISSSLSNNAMNLNNGDGLVPKTDSLTTEPPMTQKNHFVPQLNASQQLSPQLMAVQHSQPYHKHGIPLTPVQSAECTPMSNCNIPNQRSLSVGPLNPTHSYVSDNSMGSAALALANSAHLHDPSRGSISTMAQASVSGMCAAPAQGQPQVVLPFPMTPQ